MIYALSICFHNLAITYTYDYAEVYPSYMCSRVLIATETRLLWLNESFYTYIQHPYYMRTNIHSSIKDTDTFTTDFV